MGQKRSGESGYLETVSSEVDAVAAVPKRAVLLLKGHSRGASQSLAGAGLGSWASVRSSGKHLRSGCFEASWFLDSLACECSRTTGGCAKLQLHIQNPIKCYFESFSPLVHLERVSSILHISTMI